MMQPLTVVLDCDPGIDDTMAIFYGLAAPEIEIIAIGAVWGTTEVGTTTDNALRLLEMTDRTVIPVARGAAQPLVAPLPELGTIHGADGQGNTNLPRPAVRPSTETASQQIVRLAHAYPGQLTLVATGPLTNLAVALVLDPSISQLYRRIVIMGGTFLAPGNVGPFAEANIANDPEAAQRVLTAGWPITMVGLDATMPVRLTEAQLEQMAQTGSVAGRHLQRITPFYLNTRQQRLGVRECTMHDALTLAIAADPTYIARSYQAVVNVELNGAHTRGMAVADLRSALRPVPLAPTNEQLVTVVLAADGERFKARFVELMGQL